MPSLSSTSDRRLALMQLSDQFFPSGSYTLSHGLETLVHSRHLQSAAAVSEFLQLLLQTRIGPTELVAVSHAYRASAQASMAAIATVDQCLFAQTPIQIMRDTQHKSGRALMMVATSIWPEPPLQALQTEINRDRLYGLYPTVFAVIGQTLGLTETDVLMAFLHSVLSGLCGVSIRLGMIGHIQAQQTITTLAPILTALVDQTPGTPLADMWSGTPFIDIAQMRHPHLPQTLFAN